MPRVHWAATTACECDAPLFTATGLCLDCGGESDEGAPTPAPKKATRKMRRERD
jgi:hypothetical protein